MNIKYFALALSLSAFFFAGCGSDEKKPADTSLPKAAPMQEIQEPKTLNKGKIVGTAKVRQNGKTVTVDVEERTVETNDIVGKRVIQKHYYIAGTEQRIAYNPETANKDVTLKNKGESVATFRSH